MYKPCIKKRPSINEFLKDPINNSDECFNFYDWFCKETSLSNRMLKMVPKLKWLVTEGIIDGDKCYVWFKNNCPMSGGAYDDFRISTIDNDEEYLGCFCAEAPYGEGKAYSFSCRESKTSEHHDVTTSYQNWSAFKKAVKNSAVIKAKLIAQFKPKATKPLDIPTFKEDITML